MKRKENNRHKGFTLIELLVVIAIIALLLSIVLPALKKVKAQARKTICSSQLHQWGVALTAFSGDNNSRLPKTPGTSSGTAWPSMVVADKHNPAISAYYTEGDFSLETMGGYVAGYDKETTTPSHSVYFCPEASESYRQMLIDSLYVSKGYFHSTYNYFGQVKSWSALTLTPKTVERDLADNLGTTKGRKLMMADHLIKMMSTGAWAYNHGLRGPSYLFSFSAKFSFDMALTEPPAIAGTNNLFTDGSVDWKGREDFNLEKMRDLSDDGGRIGWIPSGNSTWTRTTY
jgi:prepilin-type N-terminal cleavage/methylation domain-containing protein